LKSRIFPAGAGNLQLPDISAPQIIELNYRIFALEKAVPRIATLEQTFDTFSAASGAHFSRLNTFTGTTIANLARFNQRLEEHSHTMDSPEIVAVFNRCFRDLGYPYTLADYDSRILDIGRRLIVLEGSTTAARELDWRDDFDIWSSQIYQSLSDHLESLMTVPSALDVRMSVIALCHFQWIRASHNPAAAGIESAFVIVLMSG